MRTYYKLPPLQYLTIVGYIGNGQRKLVERSLFDAGQVTIDEAIRINTTFYRAHIVDQTIFYPDVETVLRSLASAGHQLAVLTNKPEDMTRTILDHFGITNLFYQIIGGGHESFALKPDPESLNYLIDKSGLPKNQCWMIGDHHTDLMVAERANISTVFCEYGIGITGEFNPTHRIQSFNELTTIFN